ncbi:unnamed protein product [Moneuplotes crassus]|uniref:Uncharacterized protein n=1 Tax=Euplotes crassus TaxID=5936 RepID=A0AAD1XUR2_EUPCR|nr:unnamed protein product [Moneuplotes crassus]
MQVDPRLAEWTKISLTNFCCCPTEKSYLKTSQGENSNNGQQWLPKVSGCLESNSPVKNFERTYCAGVMSYNNSYACKQSNDDAKSLHQGHQQLVISESKQHDESKVDLDSECESQSQVKTSRRHRSKNEETESIEEFTLARPTQNYKTRRDLVYKAAFRRMRKYFIQDFKETTKHSLPETDYPSRLREYCAVKFPESNTDRVLVVFDCIVNSKGKLGAIPSEDRDLKNLTEKLMYFYSEKMFKRMRDHPEFLEMLLHFLNIEGVSNLIYSDNRVSFQRKVKTHLHKLKERTLRMLPSASE